MDEHFPIVSQSQALSAALDIQQETGGKGPLQPAEIRRAVQRLKARGVAPPNDYKHKRLFKR